MDVFYPHLKRDPTTPVVPRSMWPASRGHICLIVPMMSRRFEVSSHRSSSNHPSPLGSARLSKSRQRSVAAMSRSGVQRLLPFFLGCHRSRAAASSTDSACLARPRASMLVGRPADTSDKVSVAAFIVIVMAVLSRCACCSPSATASSRRASRPGR